MTRGGRRPGAGRKAKAEKYARPINAAEKRCADRLPRTIDNLEALADGGYERVSERWEPAGLVLIDAVLLGPDGAPRMDAEGKVIRTKVPAFPGKPAGELVLVQRTTEIADRDRVANIYLADRILGKPARRQEVTGPGGGPVETIGMTLDEWKREADRRRQEAEATLALLDEAGDA